MAYPVRVLFLCTHNSARSQIAEGLLRFLGGKDFEVFSAGTNPSQINPMAVQVMAERGIDISQQYSKSLDQFLDQEFDYVITVCDRAKETCPIFPGDPKQVHWSFDDPSAVEDEAARLKAFHQVATVMNTRIQGFVLTQRKILRDIGIIRPPAVTGWVREEAAAAGTQVSGSEVSFEIGKQ